jgi:hypothetical protein
MQLLRAKQITRSSDLSCKTQMQGQTATQNAIAKRRAMIAANAALVQSNKAVSASQEALNDQHL